MFLFTTSVAFDVLNEYKDELLYTYHRKLTELLKSLNFDDRIPTLLDLQSEFLKRGLLGIIRINTL